MASINSGQAAVARHELSPGAALRAAWYWYIALLFIPFLLFLVLMISQGYRHVTAVNPTSRNAWFLAAILFLLVAAPASFVVRSRLFRSYWHGRGVSPRSYLLGMMIVWMTFEAGGIISLLGCMVTNSLVPNILPALAAFMFFTPLWPNGRAMSRPVGQTDDPEIYSEPR
jgi:hypothetical protein